jgi:hypothetical protein
MSCFAITAVSLLAEASAGKVAVGWIVAFIGIALGILAVCFPSKRLSPTGEEEEDPKAKKKKKK